MLVTNELIKIPLERCKTVAECQQTVLCCRATGHMNETLPKWIIWRHQRRKLALIISRYAKHLGTYLVIELWNGRVSGGRTDGNNNWRLNQFKNDAILSFWINRQLILVQITVPPCLESVWLKRHFTKSLDVAVGDESTFAILNDSSFSLNRFCE